MPTPFAITGAVAVEVVQHLLAAVGDWDRGVPGLLPSTVEGFLDVLARVGGHVTLSFSSG
jgi:hypothetical protein